jgi:hypothetical protein
MRPTIYIPSGLTNLPVPLAFPQRKRCRHLRVFSVRSPPFELGNSLVDPRCPGPDRLDQSSTRPSSRGSLDRRSPGHSPKPIAQSE